MERKDKEGRTPQGVRGLKWIGLDYEHICYRRTPQGVRGLKSLVREHAAALGGRTPQGVRGLKCRGHCERG